MELASATMWPGRRVAANLNLLIIAVRPSEETSRVGGLIAELSRLGRPPFVTILTDGNDRRGGGSNYAVLRARATRQAVSCLGLPADRILFIGLEDGAAADGPPLQAALVAAYSLLTWVRDCHAVCTIGDEPASADHALAQAVGKALSEVADLGYLVAGVPSNGELANGLRGRLDVSRHLAAKQRALDAHRAAMVTPIAAHAAAFEDVVVLREPADRRQFWLPRNGS